MQLHDKYKINKKYFKGIMKIVVFLGFPKTVLNHLFSLEDLAVLSEDNCL